MSQIPDQLLKTSNMNIMAPLDQNMNIMNQVPLQTFISNQHNIPLNQNIPMDMPIQDNNKQPNNGDTSNYYIYII